jgi:hypothetical protein
MSLGTMVQAFAARLAGGDVVVKRPAPAFRHAPTGNVIIIERTPLFFVHPFFREHRFSTFGQPLFLGGSPVVVIDAPFFCQVDGLGFSDEAACAQHLHAAHGVPLGRARRSVSWWAGATCFSGSSATDERCKALSPAA